jgi:YfiH family protein
MSLTSKLLSQIPGIQHGFGTLKEEVPHSLQAVWKSAHPSWRQIHGKTVLEVTKPLETDLEADGFWTNKIGLPVGVISADCVPILLARADGEKVGAIHAGWRGTKAQISTHFFESQKEDPRKWVAAVGPAIGECCYEVSEELADQFSAQFRPISAQAVPRFRHLALAEINAWELKRLGVLQVEILKYCTFCSRDPLQSDSPYLHSYRREGGKTRQYSVIFRSIA